MSRGFGALQHQIIAVLREAEMMHRFLIRKRIFGGPGTPSQQASFRRAMLRLQARGEIVETLSRSHYAIAQPRINPAVEPATHRSDPPNPALAGAVASAIKFIASELLTEDVAGVPDISEPAITQFLGSIPGISSDTVKQQIANLKASGDYDRIIGEVQAELAAGPTRTPAPAAT